MRSLMYLLIAFSGLLFLNVSCNKTDDLLPPPVDSISSVLPKQVIVDDPTISYSAVFSIKYDTTNFKIEAYLDDTTNTNPYDVLSLVHNFNNSGYLVGINDISSDITIEIHRSPANTISWIRTNDNNNASLDTTFYQYQQSNGNTIITTVTNFYVSGNFQYTISETTTYNSTLKPISATDSYGSTRSITYNADGSINKVTYGGSGVSSQEDYFYNAGIPAGTVDKVLPVFMGRDYYIEGIRNLYPLTVFFTFPGLSGTDPYHVSRILATDNGATTEDRLFSYTLNADQLVSQITANVVGTPGNITYKFRY